MLTLSVSLSAPTQVGATNFEPSEPWKEAEVVIPAYPNQRSLVTVPRNPRDTYQVALDSTALSVGADGVVRFVVVVESPSGVRNVMYEGVRCDTREYKTYAAGTTSGKLQPLKDPQWRAIPGYETNNFRNDLYRNHFCDLGGARAVTDILRSLSFNSSFVYAP